jgi:DNA modification methylase
MKSAFVGNLSGSIPANNNHAEEPYTHTCGKCGATRVDNQLGLEATPAAYIEAMVQVFGGVRRVLRSDGLVFCNMGDSYQEKQLQLIPQRLAIALQDAGWWVRSIIIWDKSNPMPESVTDRPTTSHEYVLMLAKNSDYFYDCDAIREPAFAPPVTSQRSGMRSSDLATFGLTRGTNNPSVSHPAGRNKRTVWRIPSAPFPGSHFATFPPALVEPMIRCGTSERGCCAECFAPWERVVEQLSSGHRNTHKADGGQQVHLAGANHTLVAHPTVTTGWTPTCTCPTTATVPATVLDPFCGAATTLLVALRLGRRGLGIELNPEYIAMSHKRIAEDVGANQMRMVLEA